MAWTEPLGTPMPLEKSSTQICISLYKFDLHASISQLNAYQEFASHKCQTLCCPFITHSNRPELDFVI